MTGNVQHITRFFDKKWHIGFEGAYSMRWRLQSNQCRIESPRNYQKVFILRRF